MKIMDILARDAVIVELASETKNDVLAELATLRASSATRSSGKIYPPPRTAKTCFRRSKTRTASST